MRTLNRPMFNMGGPIKEGVMHGIREPYKGGGRTLAGGNQIGMPMGNRTGFADPIRKNIAKRGLGWLSTKIPGFTKGWAQRAWDKYKFPPATVTKPTGPAIWGKTTQEAVPFAQRAGQYFAKHPYLSTLGPAYLGFTDPGKGVVKTVAGAIPEVAQFATEALTPGMFEKYLPPNEWWKWGGTKWTPGDIRGETPPPNEAEVTEIIEKGVPGGGDRRMTYTYPDKASRLAKQRKDDRVNELLEIMGYDKAKKGAAYNALLDASQIIAAAPGGESLDISRDIIQPVIGATSKRFDKPQEIEEAVRLMQTKADIQKDLTKDETALANKAKRLQIKVHEKTLAGPSLTEAYNAYWEKHGSYPSGDSLANLARTKGVEVESVVDNKTIKSWLKNNKGKDEVDFMELEVKKAKEDKTPITPGVYVVTDRIIIVGVDGKVKSHL